MRTDAKEMSIKRVQVTEKERGISFVGNFLRNKTIKEVVVAQVAWRWHSDWAGQGSNPRIHCDFLLSSGQIINCNLPRRMTKIQREAGKVSQITEFGYLYFLCSQLSLILITLDGSDVLMVGALVSSIFLDPALMLKSVST